MIFFSFFSSGVFSLECSKKRPGPDVSKGNTNHSPLHFLFFFVGEGGGTLLLLLLLMLFLVGRRVCKMLMKTEKEKVTRNFFVISAILPLCCCHAILSSSVLCLFFFRKAMIHFTLRFFSSCLVLCVMDGFFFLISLASRPSFSGWRIFFFSGKIAVSLRVVQLPPRKRVASPLHVPFCVHPILSDPFPRHPGNKTKK